MAKKKKALVASYVALHRDEAGEWRWSAKAANHEIVADSGEGYRNRMYAAKVARSLFPGLPLEWHS